MADAATGTTDVAAKMKHYTMRPQIQGGALPNTKIQNSVLEQLNDKQRELSHVNRKCDYFWPAWEKQNHTL